MANSEAILHIRKILRKKGFTLRSWGRMHGYKGNTVNAVVCRHVGKETFPHGKLSTEILSRLREEVGDIEGL